MFRMNLKVSTARHSNTYFNFVFLETHASYYCVETSAVCHFRTRLVQFTIITKMVTFTIFTKVTCGTCMVHFSVRQHYEFRWRADDALSSHAIWCEPLIAGNVICQAEIKIVVVSFSAWIFAQTDDFFRIQNRYTLNRVCIPEPSVKTTKFLTTSIFRSQRPWGSEIKTTLVDVVAERSNGKRLISKNTSIDSDRTESIWTMSWTGGGTVGSCGFCNHHPHRVSTAYREGLRLWKVFALRSWFRQRKRHHRYVHINLLQWDRSSYTAYGGWLHGSLAVLQSNDRIRILCECCFIHVPRCGRSVRQHYDWRRYERLAPALHSRRRRCNMRQRLRVRHR